MLNFSSSIFRSEERETERHKKNQRNVIWDLLIKKPAGGQTTRSKRIRIDRWYWKFRNGRHTHEKFEIPIINYHSWENHFAKMTRTVILFWPNADCLGQSKNKILWLWNWIFFEGGFCWRGKLMKISHFSDSSCLEFSFSTSSLRRI